MKHLFTGQTKYFLLLLLALCSLMAWADEWQDPETKVIYAYTSGMAEASVKAGSYFPYSAGSPDVIGDITIQSVITVDGVQYPVTTIGDLAFYGCSDFAAKQT